MRQSRISRTFLLWLITFQIIYLFLPLLFETQQFAESFVTIPAELAFGIITAAVKLKLILVKILFAMKTIGLLRGYPMPFVQVGRYKRSITSVSSEEGTQKHKHQAEFIEHTFKEILSAWSELESAADQPLQFDLEYCRQGAMNPYSVAYPAKRCRRRDATISTINKFYDNDSNSMEQNSLENLKLYFDSKESSSFETGSASAEVIKIDTKSDSARDQNAKAALDVSYSQFLSSIIGSMMQNLEGCELLEEGLIVKAADRFYLGVASKEDSTDSTSAEYPLGSKHK